MPTTETFSTVNNFVINDVPEYMKVQKNKHHVRYFKKRVGEGYVWVRNNNFSRNGLSYKI